MPGRSRVVQRVIAGFGLGLCSSRASVALTLLVDLKMTFFFHIGASAEANTIGLGLAILARGRGPHFLEVHTAQTRQGSPTWLPRSLAGPSYRRHNRTSSGASLVVSRGQDTGQEKPNIEGFRTGTEAASSGGPLPGRWPQETLFICLETVSRPPEGRLGVCGSTKEPVKAVH